MTSCVGCGTSRGALRGEALCDIRVIEDKRRRHEDEQLAHRLQELHSKKEKRESADIENIKDELAPDDELRRQKLEMLRSQLSTDSTPNKEPDTLDTVFLTSIHPSDSESQEFRSEYTDTGQKQDECTMRLDANSDDINMGAGVKHDHLLLSRETDQRESKYSGLSVNLTKNKPDSCVLLTSSLDDHQSLYVRMPECDKTRPKSPEKFWEQSKNIDSDYPMKEKLIKDMPEIVPEQCVIVGHVNQKLEDLISDSFQSTSSKLNDSINDSVFIHNSDDEPDIVKSTKSRNTTPTQSLGREVNPSNIQVLVREVSPPDTLLPPVAPPRRKKRNRAAQSGNSISESSTEVRPLSNISLEPMSPGLPPSVDTPTADIIRHLSKGLDHSLDIQSVIDGKRHIRTEEAEIGAINSDKSLSPDVSHLLLREKLRVQRLSGETSSSCGTSSLPSSPRPKRPERSISTQSHSDEDIAMRPRSNSGRLLTDKEILESVMVLNLDTGEQIPLSVAEEKLAKCMNPLALYIMRRTKEYNSDSNLQKQFDNLTDDDVDAKSEGGLSSGSSEQSAKTKAVKLKKLIGRTMGKTMHKVKHAAEQGRKVLEGDETGMEEEFSVDGKRFKFKASRQNKGPYDFSRFRILQDLAGEHTGAVWTMKFSTCGRLLATGGQDSILRVWVLKSAHAYFDELRQKYSEVRVSPAPSHESLDSISSDNSAGPIPGPDDGDKHAPFMKKPFCVYRGHIADLLDLSWSKNYFILSSSMDKTVRLWHISRKECLCTFQHIDFVTAIAFHPRDDRYFLSGSLDGKLRLWNIPDKNVALWNEVGSPSNLITTANFCQNGKFAVVGTYDGKCIFYSTEQLKYYTQIHVRSTRGKNARGRKITGIEPLPTEDKILVTSNDSRIRLYDLRDLTLTGKYKGCTNNSSQIKASFSSGGKYIICGSEDQFMYIWKTHHDYYKFSSARRDRNDYWEAIKVHNAVVTTAIFASHPMLFFPDHADTQSMPPLSDETSSQQGEIIISADFSGTIKVIQNKISVIA